MGGCVASVMDRQSRGSLVDDPILQSARNYGPNSVAVPGSETATSSAIYRNGKHGSEEAFQRERQAILDLPSLPHRLYETCRNRKDEKLVAHRPVDKVVKEVHVVGGVERELDITYLKETEFLTMGQLWGIMEDFSRGLAELGLQPGDVVAMFEETRWEWLTSVYAIWLQDMVASTVYANLGEDALHYALRETESKAIVCNGRSVPNLLKGIAAGSFPACVIIYLDELPTDGTGDDANKHHCRIVRWQEVVSLGQQTKDKHKAELPADLDKTALIMYTSGTVAEPKGVVHTHRTFGCGVRVLELYIISILGDPLSTETYCSYLPLAHIMELGVVNVFLVNGATVGFGGPRTLTDVTARPCGDFVAYRPTAMVGVSRIYDTVKRAVEANLPPPGSFKRQIFDAAYQARLAAIKEGKDTPYWNEKVFNIPRKVMGGRMRAMLSGGGPTNESTQEFVNVVFGSLVIGWGLTETVCVGAIQRLGDLEKNCTGQVLVGEELKLVDTEEYKHTDQPEPRGELCLRGPFLFKEYYKNPKLTKEAIDEDGWFHTGDVGSIGANGKVRIVGRVKALAKNVLGEYIPLEALEAIYADAPLVLNNCVCVVVHPDKNYIAAILITDKARAMKFAKEKGVPGEWPQILQSDAFSKAAAESLQTVAKAANRRQYELVKRVRVLADDWTPDNGVLTAALKLKRREIDERYAREIAELFQD